MFRNAFKLVSVRPMWWSWPMLILLACASNPTVPAEPAPGPAAAAESAPVAPRRELPTREEEETEARLAWEAHEGRMSWDERLEQMGLDLDPGADPDPNEIFTRFGKPFRIEKYPKEHAIYRGQEMGWVRPMKGVGIPFEIYRDNEEYVWVWIPEKDLRSREERAEIAKYPERNLSEEDKEGYLKVREEFYLSDPPASSTVVRFREASEGLPRKGSFRNAPAIADMNGDGFLDIVIPPQRGGGLDSLAPAIFLGDGGSSWRRWETRWPKAINYGDVSAADFNGDGRMDLAFAIHLIGAAVFLGDGEGNFIDASQGLPSNYPSRQIEVTDVDLDDDLDLVVLTEGPMKGREEEVRGRGRMRVYLNDGSGTKWSEISIGEYWEVMGGDWLAVGRFNEDPYPDFLASSIYFHGVDLFWMSQGPAEWASFGRGFLPFYGYVSEVATVEGSAPDRDDAIVTFGRFWRVQVNPEEVEPPPFRSVVGIERVSFGEAGPTRERIVSWASKEPVWALTTADFDRDGVDDILFRRNNPQGMHLLLGRPDGSYVWGKTEGIDFLDNTAYDLTTADVNGDGWEDVIVLYEASAKTLTERDGSIRVYLNEGAGR